MIHRKDGIKPGYRKASLIKFAVVLLAIAMVCFILQYNTIKKTVQMRLFDISSDYVVRKEEIKEITNQAVAKIEMRQQESLSEIDNKTKELLLNETSDNQEVVTKDVLKAVNKARRETR